MLVCNTRLDHVPIISHSNNLPQQIIYIGIFTHEIVIGSKWVEQSGNNNYYVFLYIDFWRLAT